MVNNSKHNSVTLPNTWKMVELSEISKVERGRFSHRPRNAPQFYGGDMPFVQTGEVSNSNGYIKIYSQTLNELGCSISKVFPKGTILVTIAANIGDCGILEFESACPDSLIAVTPKNEADKHFLNYFLGTQKSRILYLAPQGAQKNINIEFLSQIVVPLPPLDEQKKIAEILSTWDKAVETTEKLIAAKQKLKKSLMQRLLTGSQRFPEFHGQKWKEARLKDVFSEIRNINDGGDSHSVMTISARRGLISQQDKFNRVIAGDSLKKYTQLKRGDFAYNKGNSKTYEMGCIYQLESKESALVPFVYICFSPSEKVFSSFYKHWFLAHGLDKQLKKIITSGARGDGLLNVNSEDFFKLKIPVPPLEEQKKIAAALNSCDAEINVLQTKLAALRQQKRGMMQKLLTGQVRVKIDEN